MPKRRFIFAIISTLCVASCGSNEAAPPATRSAEELPQAIKDFRAKVVDMNAKEALVAATTQFGEPTRNVGSGLSIPLWDVAGGSLIVHPFNGPTFRSANGKTTWLISPSNTAQENLQQEFEINTFPDPHNHGTRFWIGNLQLAKDGTYRYADSGSNLTDRGDQSANFFIHHPQGRVEIIWLNGINANSQLEPLGGCDLARLLFSSNDGKTKFECKVVSNAESRGLSITGDTFVMDAGWLHFWSKQAAASGKE